MDDLERRLLFEYLTALADDRIVLGQRLTEWMGVAPILEEETAVGNLALDLIGQASALYRTAGEVEGDGRDEDALAMHRDIHDFRCMLLVQQPNGDWGRTMVRQYLFDAFDVLLMDRLRSVSHQPLADIAAKAWVENRYHLRHSGSWIHRLADGTDESRKRIQQGINDCWPFIDDMFEFPRQWQSIARAGIVVDFADLRNNWEDEVGDMLRDHGLSTPEDIWMPTGGREGVHSEDLRNLLTTMQSVARAFPEEKW